LSDALRKSFFDGNNHAARFMMNGIGAMSIPTAHAQTFDKAMVPLYLTKKAQESGKVCNRVVVPGSDLSLDHIS
jgi:hypothetical protein